MTLRDERTAFVFAKKEWIDHARQTAALLVLCGIDLEKALRSSGQERDKVVARLRRILERERLRGARRHWAYDLNRHIALKQALDRLDNSSPARRSIGGSVPSSKEKRRRSAALVPL